MLAGFVSTAFFCASARAGTAQVGKQAPDFTTTDITGKAFNLSDFRGKIVVLEWVNPECPFVRKHYGSGNIPGLQRSAMENGVVWISINSAAQGQQGDYDTMQVTEWQSANKAAPAAYVRDSSGAIGRLYGAKTTPHLFVISADGTLVYEGAIDSIRSTKVDDIARATNYVTAALTSLKNGTPVEKSSSEPYGCAVKY